MRSSKASIVKLGKDHYRVFVSSGTGAGGKRYRRSKTIRGSRRQAEEAKLKLLAEIGDGSSDTTLADYVHSVFLPAKGSTLKVRSSQSIADRLRLYVLPGLGKYRLSALSSRRIKAWLAAFDRPSIRFVAFTSLRQVLNQALRDEYLETSPLAKVEPIKRGRYEPDVLDVQDVEVYLWHFDGSPVYDAVLLALGGGFRRGEIAALDWTDITADGVVTIDDAIVQHGREIQHTSPKSASGTRRVVLPSYILQRLTRPLDASEAVLQEGGMRMKPDRITQLYRQRLAELPPGVPRVPFKNLRHSSLSLAYDSGADILSVSRRAGHSTTAITEQYYVRPKGSRDAETARQMDAALGGVSACQKVPNLSKSLDNP